jgi:hypothetical protein
MTLPFGNCKSSAAMLARDERRGSGRLAPVEIEAEAPDVGAAVGRHHHVVAVEHRESREVGDLGEVVPVEAQQSLVDHRDDQQRSVGGPAEARRLPLDPHDLLDRAARVERQHLVRVLVGEPEPSVVPAWPFRERQTVDHRAQFSHRLPPRAESLPRRLRARPTG